MDLKLNGKRALVLASSSGLGYAVAAELAREGARVATNSRSIDRARAAAERIRAESGGQAQAFAADVRSREDVRTLIDDVAEALGGLDILVTNAGGPPPGGFDALDEDAWESTHQLTLQSVVRSVRYALPHLREGGGAILALASSSVARPIPNLLLSNVYRPAVNALCKSLALELAKDGIRVNVLSPGRIHTDRTDQLDAAKAERTGKSLDEVRRASAASIPMGRLGRIEEFGRVAAFLVSDAASYMTGESVYCDGGLVDCL